MTEDTIRIVEGVGPMRFDASMKPEEIDAAVERLSKNATVATPTPTPPTGGTWDANNIYHPAGQPAGRDTSFLGIPIHIPPPDRDRPDRNVIGLSDGTGVSPEMLLGAGGALRAVVNSTKAAGAAGGAWEALQQAAPALRYEVYSSILGKMNIPGAKAIALVLSGYSPKGGRAAAGGAVEAPPEPASPIPGTGTSMTPGAVPPTAWPTPTPRVPVVVRVGTKTGMTPGVVPPTAWPEPAPRAPTPAPVRTGSSMSPGAVPPTAWPPPPAAAPAAAPPPPPAAPPPAPPRTTGTAMTPGAVPPTSWQGTGAAPATTPEAQANAVGAFLNRFPGVAEGGAAPAAAAPAAAAPAATKASAVEQATAALTDAGMSAARATSIVKAWTRQGVTDLSRAATHFIENWMKD